MADGYGFMPNDRAFRDLIKERFRGGRSKQPAVPPTRGETGGYFRSSSLGGVCGRLESLKIRHGKVTHEDYSPEVRNLFAKGHAYHYMHQEIVLPAVAQDAILGWWQSPKGLISGNNEDGTPILWSRSEAAKHASVPEEWLRYEEAHIFDHEHFVSGHPDIIFDWSRAGYDHPNHDDGLEVWELKTRHDSSWTWDAIDPDLGGAPLPKHILQIQSYLMMTGIEWGRIIYMKKGDNEVKDGLHASYVEHRVRADPGVHKQIRDYVDAYHALIWKSRTSKFVPARTQCSSFSKGAAIKCPLRYLCFEKPQKNTGLIRDMTEEESVANKTAVESALDLLT